MFAKRVLISAAMLVVALAGGASAEDAMAKGNSMAGDGMAIGAMAPMMSDADLARCVSEAKAISFPEVAMVAEQACQTLHDAMGGAMMGGDTMAPKQ